MMNTVIISLLAIVFNIIIVALVINSFTDRKELKRIEKQFQEDMQRLEEEKKLKKEREKKADEKKTEMHEGTATDNLNSSVDILHKYASRNH